MPIENVTPNRGYQLPHAANDLIDDVSRLIAGLLGVDLDVANILAALLTKADKDHEHVIADIVGLAAALSARQETAAKGQANGYASLGSDGKVPAAQLPSTVFGALSYQGAWNASTNSPTIPAANAGNKGHYYKVSAAGTTTVSGINDWEVGDWIVSNGTTWDKIDNTDQVLSVAGLRGAITAAALKTALAIAVADITGLGNSATRNVGTASGTVAAGNDSRIVGAVQSNDSRLSDSREWTAAVISQAEAEAGTATTPRKFTAQRVKQAIEALAPASPVGLYTGSARDQTTFPVGHVVGVFEANGALQRNQAVTLRLPPDVGDPALPGYTTTGGGTALAGTWRARGRVGTGSNAGTIFQRVA